MRWHYVKRKMIKNFTWPLKIATHEIEVTRLYPEFHDAAS